VVTEKPSSSLATSRLSLSLPFSSKRLVVTPASGSIAEALNNRMLPRNSQRTKLYGN